MSLLLLSPAAFAVEVGEQIQIPRSQIQCVDQEAKPRPPKHCPYCYELPQTDSIVTVNLNVDGVEKFTGASYYNCAQLDQILGNPAVAEVSQVSVRKIGDLVHRLIELKLAGVIVTGQTN
jgi:hypothetical protein